jgi:hypothetical protein
MVSFGKLPKQNIEIKLALDKIILKISVDGLISRHSWTELEI